MVKLLWKTAWHFLKKINSITLWACISTNSGIPKELEARIWKHLYITVHSNIIHNSQLEEPTQMFPDENMDK